MGQILKLTPEKINFLRNTKSKENKVIPSALVIPETLTERGLLICLQYSSLKAIISAVLLPSYNTNELLSIKCSKQWCLFGLNWKEIPLLRSIFSYIGGELKSPASSLILSQFIPPTVHCGLPTCF